MATKIVTFVRDRQSTLASGLAALLIIVVGFLVFNYFSGFNKTSAPQITPESTQTAQLNSNPTGSPQGTNSQASLGTTNSNLPTTYTVVRGDNLSSIAQKYYGDGGKWTEIAKANNLANPSVIHAGNVLSIPKLETGTSVAQSSGTAVSPSRIGSTVTVKQGDTLWSIAIQAYGSGYEWYRIDQANPVIPRNALGKPLITSGQQLKLP